MKPPKAGGGLPAIWYLFRKARESGGLLEMYRAMRTPNACKTCALGMGGQQGGMVNEAGHFPEVCKKSVQAMAADMQGQISPHFFETTSLAQLAQMSPRQLESAGRITRPVYAGPLDTRYREISWDEALAKVVSKFRETSPDRSFFYVSGRSSNEAGFLLQLFARAIGTNNVNNCSYYCHQASGVGLSSVTGSGTATVVLEDVERLGKGDVFFLIGANPASNHPRLMTLLADLKRRGGKVVVINPLRETGLVRFRVPSRPTSLIFGTTIADEYAQPHIGADIALLAGIAKAVGEIGAVDEGFVASHTSGWTEYDASIAEMGWPEIVETSGVPREQILRIANLYASAPNAIFAWAMGITHHAHGVQNVRAIANLAMLRGMLGRPGAGLLPIRGHSNVQGIGSVGVTPALRDAVWAAMSEHLGIGKVEASGLDTMGCMLGAANGELDLGLCLGGNLFGSNPDADFAARALQSLDMLVYLSTTLNTGHAVGRARETIILPVLARDEEEQPTTQESMFNFVRLSDGGPPRHNGPRSEVSVVAAIAAGVDKTSGLDWSAFRRHRRIRDAIARIVPGYEAIGNIDETRSEFHIEGRTFHNPDFATEDGRARFHPMSLPITGSGNGHLRLMTVRSEGQFNTVVYEEQDIYRGQERRDVILMSVDDIQRLGLQVDQQVRVVGEAGHMDDIRVRPIDIRQGNAVMYYPEANVLLPKTLDPDSRTPAFKGSLISIAVD